MEKNQKLKKVRRSVESGVSFSKLYFSKPTSVVLVTVYAAILVLAIGAVGLSKLIESSNQPETEVPSLPETTFSFLPADNIEIPELGGAEDTEEKSAEVTTSEEKTEATSNNYRSPATAATPVIVEVEKEVVKTNEVVKEVVKEVPVAVKETDAQEAKSPSQIGSSPQTALDENINNVPAMQSEQTSYDNYNAPSMENFPAPTPTPEPEPEPEIELETPDSDEENSSSPEE